MKENKNNQQDEKQKYDLKPCQFCGGDAVLRNDKNSFVLYSVVECTSCNIEGKRFSIAYDICANDEAVKAWNRRTEDES